MAFEYEILMELIQMTKDSRHPSNKGLVTYTYKAPNLRLFLEREGDAGRQKLLEAIDKMREELTHRDLE